MTADLTPDRAKDPDEVRDYVINWVSRVGADPIITSVWAISNGAGLTILSNSYTVQTTTVWLSAGTDGITYTLTNTITTQGGRVLQEAFKLRVKSQI
jgi:hypothetical protein